MSKEVIITNKTVVSCNGDDSKGSNHPKGVAKNKRDREFYRLPLL